MLLRKHALEMKASSECEADYGDKNSRNLGEPFSSLSRGQVVFINSIVQFSNLFMP